MTDAGGTGGGALDKIVSERVTSGRRLMSAVAWMQQHDEPVDQQLWDGIWHIAKNAKSYRTRLLAKRMLADRIDPVPRPTDADTHRPPLTHVSFELRAGPEPATRIHVNGAEVHLGGSGWEALGVPDPGATGRGKTITALAAMIAHGVEHVRAGHAAPTRWLGVRDSFENHKANVHQSIHEPIWDGQWRLVDGGHRAVFDYNGRPLVDLRLVGIPDVGEIEKLRTAVHGVWFEEPSPITGISHSGLTLTAYSTALSPRAYRAT